MTEAAIIALRAILLPLALWTLWLSWRGFANMWRGSLALGDKSNAAAFWFACSSVIGQVFFLLWPQPQVLVLALLCAVVSHGLMIRVRLVASKLGRVDIERILNHPELFLPMAELHEVNPHAAEQYAAMIRKALARTMADG